MHRAVSVAGHVTAAPVNSEAIPPLVHEEFPACRDWVLLEAANVAPTAKPCYDATAAWQKSLFRNGAAVFNDDHEEQAFEPLRQEASRLLNCRPIDVAGGSSCTELLQSLAWAMMPPKGSNIVGTAACFPSSFYPFIRVAEHTGAGIRLVPHDENFVTSEESLLALIDENTSIVALSHVEFTSGQLYDIPRIAARAHEMGAKLVVDGSQSVGMVPIDVRQHDHFADAIATTGYKWLCGAFGGAFMYVAPALQHLVPGLVGFRSHVDMWEPDVARLSYPHGAKRYEFATMHFGSVLGLARAIELLVDVGMERIWQHDLQLGDYLATQLRQKLGAKVTIVSPQGRARSAVVSLRLQGSSAEVVAAQLQAKFKIKVTNRGPFLRIAPHLYNGSADVNAFVDALSQVLAVEAHG
jgi:selenocysteine lyase/cysteine desulfurase